MGDVLQPDSARAIALLESSAASGYPPALFVLAWQLEIGTHVKPDPVRALQLYTAAANQGYCLARSRLARIYSAGELGQARSAELARHWECR